MGVRFGFVYLVSLFGKDFGRILYDFRFGVVCFNVSLKKYLVIKSLYTLELIKCFWYM